MIDKEQLETFRALAAKRGHDGIDASKALLALPMLLAEVDEKHQLIADIIALANEWKKTLARIECRMHDELAELKARAGL